MRNHFFIGLGGQGCRSLHELRRVIEQRESDAIQLKENGSKWDYLCIDSDSEEIHESKWTKYFGKDISLANRQKLILDSLPQAAMLSNRPDIFPWIGEGPILDGYLAKFHGFGGANQRRRLGRLLFAYNADKILRACERQISQLIESSYNECTIHIFASLAGGTGSGGIVDLITSLRTQFPKGDTDSGFPIFLYLFITDIDGTASDVGYFYSNQYAALRDLNALMLGRLQSHLLGSRHDGRVFEGTHPINTLSLFSSRNSSDRYLSLHDQIRTAAESCFERIYSFATGKLSPHCQKAMTGEDILTAFPGEPEQQPERSYRFASSGIRKWEAPSEMIVKALSLDLMVSSINQMLFQNWEGMRGFSDLMVELGGHRLENFRSNLIQLVNKRMLSNSGNSLDLSLRRDLEKIEVAVLSAQGNSKSLKELEEIFFKYFNETFQGSGIHSYLISVAANRKSTLKELVEEVEALLTRAWNNVDTPISLSQIPQILESLELDLNEDISTYQGTSTHRDILAFRLAAREQEWKKLTKFSILRGKREALFRDHAKDLKSELALQLSDLCYSQDLEFKRELLSEIKRLSSAYRAAFQTVSHLKSKVSFERDAIFDGLFNIRDSDASTKYELQVPAFRDFHEELKKHKFHQERSAFMMRSKVVPDGMKLTRFRGNIATDVKIIEENMREAASERINSIHEEFVAEGIISEVINIPLLDILEQRFTTNEKLLLDEYSEFVALAASSLQIDQNQVQPSVLFGGKVGVPAMPKRVMVLGIPRHRFAETLKKAIFEAIPAGHSYVTEAYTHNNPTQLRLFVMDYWMAARFSVTVNQLAKRYAVTSIQNSTSDLNYFCNIDLDGELGRRFDLLLPEQDRLKAKAETEAEFWSSSSERGAKSTDDEKNFSTLEAHVGTDEYRQRDEKQKRGTDPNLPVPKRIDEYALEFRVVSRQWDIPKQAKGVAYLLRDSWDDFGYHTAFDLTIFGFDGLKFSAGALKIADLKGGKGYTQLPSSFTNLDGRYVSLGMGVSYYQTLRCLPESLSRQIFSSLGDISYSDSQWEFAKMEEVVIMSLLRSIPEAVVRGQFRRIAQGGELLTAYRFVYEWPLSDGLENPPTLDFNVDPESPIPSNVHVIIGRNGVGKSRLFHNMAKALLNVEPEPIQVGVFKDITEGVIGKSFTGLVYVSFSAFDRNEPFDTERPIPNEISCERVGLWSSSSRSRVSDYSLEEQLHRAFGASSTAIISRGRAKEWRNYVRKLDSDPGFCDLNIDSVLDVTRFVDDTNSHLNMPSDIEMRLFANASAFFDKLSSGHKVVLLALTRLVECVNEKTLVLIDEPEGHLHPPLLSAFVRVLCDLMTERNGVAIVATHSPVVLQEVPKSCVWHLERYGGIARAVRPDYETFGENVGVLTGRVFGYEVTDSGFHQLIRRIASESSTYDEAVGKLEGQLGSEAKAILMGLIMSEKDGG